MAIPTDRTAMIRNLRSSGKVPQLLRIASTGQRRRRSRAGKSEKRPLKPRGAPSIDGISASLMGHQQRYTRKFAGLLKLRQRQRLALPDEASPTILKHPAFWEPCPPASDHGADRSRLLPATKPPQHPAKEYDYPIEFALQFRNININEQRFIYRALRMPHYENRGLFWQKAQR